MNIKIGKLISTPFKAVGNFFRKSMTMAAIAVRFKGAIGMFGNPNDTMSFAEAARVHGSCVGLPLHQCLWRRGWQR